MFSLSDFNVDPKILESQKDLLDLILRSVTLETKEQKQYWIDSLPQMDEDQLLNLKKILLDEQDELQKIEEKYDLKDEEKKQELLKIREEKMREQRDDRKRAEADSDELEDEIEDQLLGQLENL